MLLYSHSRNRLDQYTPSNSLQDPPPRPQRQLFLEWPALNCGPPRNAGLWYIVISYEIESEGFGQKTKNNVVFEPLYMHFSCIYRSW
jgi:hypothetical protein